MFHTDKVPVCFHKDKQGLPYIDLDAPVYDATTILVQMVRSNYKVGTSLICGEEGHWANMPPFLLEEQQSQLQMNIVIEDEASNKGNQDAK